jgi:MoaA/NifB/PqqE/SkfB family radical SAM enzyme
LENVNELQKTKSPKVINFTFDRSCNFQCPSCRVELINYKGNKRLSVEKKLTEINDEISPFVERLVLSGSADPFFSKSFRQFLITLDSNKFKKLKSIHLHTNGSLWTPEMWDKMSGIHRYVNTCEISIDAATKETYETKTRIGGNWNVLHENLNFITKIPTIKGYIFSFVVQDTNYKEMYDFYKMIKSYMDNRESKVKWEIRTNVISDWGTFSEAEFKIKNVANPEHSEHNLFLLELDKVKNIPNVLHNFHHLYETEKPLI